LTGHFAVLESLGVEEWDTGGFGASFEAKEIGVEEEVCVAAFVSFFPSISAALDEGVWQQLVPVFVSAAESGAGAKQKRPSTNNAVAIRRGGRKQFIADFTNRALANLGKVPIAMHDQSFADPLLHGSDDF